MGTRPRSPPGLDLPGPAPRRSGRPLPSHSPQPVRVARCPSGGPGGAACRSAAWGKATRVSTAASYAGAAGDDSPLLKPAGRERAGRTVCEPTAGDARAAARGAVRGAVGQRPARSPRPGAQPGPPGGALGGEPCPLPPPARGIPKKQNPGVRRVRGSVRPVRGSVRPPRDGQRAGLGQGPGARAPPPRAGPAPRCAEQLRSGAA